MNKTVKFLPDSLINTNDYLCFDNKTNREVVVVTDCYERLLNNA